MSQTINEENWKEEGRDWGLKCGALAVVLTIVLYYVNTDWLFSKWLLLGVNFIFVVGIFLVQSKVDSLELKPYIQPGFLVFVVGNLIFYAFFHLLFAHIDPNLVDMQAEFMKASGEVGEDFKASSLEPTIKNTFDNYLRSLIAGFVLAALMGLVFKYQRSNR